MDDPDVIEFSAPKREPGQLIQYRRVCPAVVAQDIDVMDAKPVKSSCLKPPIKSPREILIEINDEFSELEDLGVRINQNFKAKCQLESPIKRRDYFNMVSDDDLQLSNGHNGKPVCLFSKPRFEAFGGQTSPKSPVRTYSNRRRLFQDSRNFTVESFGLPDETIFGLKNPYFLEHNEKIERDFASPPNPSLRSPTAIEFPQVVKEKTNNGDARVSLLDVGLPQPLRQPEPRPEIKNNNTIFDGKILTNGAPTASVIDLTEKAGTEAVKTKRWRARRRNPDTMLIIDNIDLTKPTVLRGKKVLNNAAIIDLTAEKQAPKDTQLEGDCIATVDKNSKFDKSGNPVVVLNKVEARPDVQLKKIANLQEVTLTKLNTEEKCLERRVLRSSLTKTPDIGEVGDKKALRSTLTRVSDLDKGKLKAPVCASLAQAPNIAKTGIKLEVITKTEPGTRLINSSDNGAGYEEQGLTPKRILRSSLIKASFVASIEESYVEDTSKRVLRSSLIKSSPVEEKPEVIPVIKKERKKRSRLVYNPFSANSLDTVDKRMLRSSNGHDQEISQSESTLDLSNFRSENVEFEVGDLVWAKMSRFPFWPCLVIKEPTSGDHQRRVFNAGRLMYHVRFYGDKGRRAWVSAKNLLPFTSRNDLDSLAKQMSTEKNSKLIIKEYFHVKPISVEKWAAGVTEAEISKAKPRADRESYFLEKFDDRHAKKQVRKRRFQDSPEQHKTRNSPKQNSDDFSKRKRQKLDEVDEEEPNKRLEADSKFSDVPTTLEHIANLYRRNNILKGVIREKKVCQICYQTGEVFKCRGPCNGFYHTNCGINQESPDELNNLTLSEKIDYRMAQLMKNTQYKSYTESPDSSSDWSFSEDNGQRLGKNLSLRVTSKPSPKDIPIVTHVEEDQISYICVTDVDKTNKNLRCKWCTGNVPLECLICHQRDSDLGSGKLEKCSLRHCGKYYHKECVSKWPQTQHSLLRGEKEDAFICPRHVCHTCVADDPRMADSRSGKDIKLTKCLKCPATFHANSFCVPAATDILTITQIRCPRHCQYNTKRNAVNANWCFICSEGGDLICCEICPTSVHKECQPGGINELETFICEDCQSGRLPLYNEIVWVKHSRFRWWPAVILFPTEIPSNLQKVAHDKGEYAVRFFATYDYAWVARGRLFLFQEGDRGQCRTKNGIDVAFRQAIDEAAAAHELLKQFNINRFAAMTVKPPPYIKIKVNKPVGNVRLFDQDSSNTTSCNCDPVQPFPCGPDSDCLNRLLLFECNAEVCAAGDRCNNQCFEKRDYPPLTPYYTTVRGWGLKTLGPLRKGQFVIEYVGELIDEEEYQRRVKKMNEQKEDNYYFLRLDTQRMIDAGPKGNMSRFMNHSCQPNCETQKWTVNGDTRVGLFAACDISADTELTFNYNLACIGKEKKICRCGASNCKGFIGDNIRIKQEISGKKSIKVKKKVAEIPIITEPCFVCGKKGDVKGCNHKSCTKFYHLECVALKSWPEGNKWVCQWHNCNICSKRTIRCCVKCLNSYCPSHAENNVRYQNKERGFICSEHDPLKPRVILINVEDPQEMSLLDRLQTLASSTPVKTSDRTKPNGRVKCDLKLNVTESQGVLLKKRGLRRGTAL